MGKCEEYAGLFAEKGDFDIPSHFSVGVAWQATSSMVVAFDYRRINYTDVAAVSNDAQRLTDLAGSCLASPTNMGPAPNSGTAPGGPHTSLCVPVPGRSFLAGLDREGVVEPAITVVPLSWSWRAL